jgi:predicted DNA-binding transcriptional regulator AlpA
MSTNTPPPDRAVRKPERRKITGVPDSSWDVQEHAGLAPKRFPLTTGTVAWSFNELTDWVEAQKAKRADTWRTFGHAAARVIKKIESRR